MVSAHRMSYKFLVDEELPDNMVVRHTCDNPICVNPYHLISGTVQDNIDDRTARGRAHSVLSFDDVVDIKNQIAVAKPKDGTQTRLALKYNIAVSSISDIRQERSWVHVPWPDGYSSEYKT